MVRAARRVQAFGADQVTTAGHKAVVEHTGRYGAKIVLVGADGRLGDLQVTSVGRGRARLRARRRRAPGVGPRAHRVGAQHPVRVVEDGSARAASAAAPGRRTRPRPPRPARPPECASRSPPRPSLPDLDEDGPALLAALAAVGVEAHVAVWDDPTVLCGSYDLVLVRSVWDYPGRREEFLAWADASPRSRAANPAPVLRWNTDKSYLRDLGAAGVPASRRSSCPPARPLPPTAGEYVLKPTVSAGADETARYGAGERDDRRGAPGTAARRRPDRDAPALPGRGGLARGDRACCTSAGSSPTPSARARSCFPGAGRRRR